MSDPVTAHILLVEDEDDLASLVEVNLELAGHRVSIARDGGEGLQRARELAPDLILLDVMMPVLDGWRVLQRLKDDEDTEDIPVVMLTALSEERDLIRGHLEGAIHYVTKPFRMQELLDVVTEGLREPSPEELAVRRQRVRALLQRLAELDSGRRAEGPQVSLSALEHQPSRVTGPPEVTDRDRERLESLTERQRWLLEQFAAGRGARDIAEELDVSRSNVYATRKRIARKLSVEPDDVSDVARRFGLRGADRTTDE